MKLKRAKQYKRLIHLYEANFGFRQPFQVIVDGTFFAAALKAKLDIQTQLPRVVDGTVHYMTTNCVLQEIRSLGPDLSGVAIAAKRTEKRRCDHRHVHDVPVVVEREQTGKIDISRKKKPSTSYIPAASCLLSLVSPENPHRYCIATQDPSLRSKLRQIPGVPILHIKNSVLVLEPASDVTKEWVKNHEKSKLKPLPFEKSIQTLVEEKKETPVIKKKKPKTPNPLSVKKSKAELEQAKKERNRKRRERKLRKEAREAQSTGEAEEWNVEESGESQGRFVRLNVDVMES